MLEKFGIKCEAFVRNYVPDPFVLVLLLTIFTSGLTFWITPTRPNDLLRYWSTGFWELLSFAMQMVLIIATGESITESRFVQKTLKNVCSLPKSAYSAVLGLTFFSLIAGWIHWGFGLVAASIAGREIGRSLQQRKITIHYPILGAAAYMSMLLWHAGTTASAPLLINTPGHFLYKEIGLIPLSQTIFLPANLITCVVLAVIIPFVVANLIPRRQIQTFDQFGIEGNRISRGKISEEKPRSFAQKLERSYLTNAIIGTMGGLVIFRYFRSEGLNLNHNIVNFMFLTVGILLHRNPLDYCKAFSNSVRGTAGIILQFPFYGGIMGIMRDSGLGHDIATVFVQLSQDRTLPFYSYLASVVTKIFIPSGGGEWAVEGPVMLQAAKKLGAPVGLVTMGVAYGNMVGNLFQPFWAIPLLNIMGLKARDIMGYCLAVFIFAFPILAIALLFA